MRALIADKVAPTVAPALESAGCAVQSDPALSGATLAAALRTLQPHILIVRSTKVDLSHFDAGQNLALIIRAGAGVNTIDLETASNRGVYVANCPGKNAIAVAELTLAHLLNLDRRIADNVIALRAHRWAKKEFGKSRGLYGRTLAVLGTGRIGQEVIRLAQAFGMTVHAWSRSLTPETADELGVTHAATPHEACRGADALTVHLALNDDTRGLVSTELLDALAHGAYVINTSRGGVIDEAALRIACKKRGIRAGLDVYGSEPGSGETVFDNPIADEPSVYGTHHIGASTEQAEEAVGEDVVRIVTAWLRTGRVPNCVNLAQATPATHQITIRHVDRVGVLAGVLDVLRRADFNVQEMDNIVFRGAHAACAHIQVDRMPTPALISEIADSPDIFAASVVALEDG